jgi:hypothetical protein
VARGRGRRGGPVPRRSRARADAGGRRHGSRADGGVGRRRTPQQALKSHQIRVDGARRDAERLWQWLGTSAFAPTGARRHDETDPSGRAARVRGVVPSLRADLRRRDCRDRGGTRRARARGQFITFETVGGRNVAYVAYFTYTPEGRATWHVGNADYGRVPRASRFRSSRVRARDSARNSAAPTCASPGGQRHARVRLVHADADAHSGMADMTLDLTRLVGPLAGAGCGETAPPRANLTGVRVGIVDGYAGARAAAGPLPHRSRTVGPSRNDSRLRAHYFTSPCRAARPDVARGPTLDFAMAPTSA